MQETILTPTDPAESNLSVPNPETQPTIVIPETPPRTLEQIYADNPKLSEDLASAQKGSTDGYKYINDYEMRLFASDHKDELPELITAAKAKGFDSLVASLERAERLKSKIDSLVISADEQQYMGLDSSIEQDQFYKEISDKKNAEALSLTLNGRSPKDVSNEEFMDRINSEECLRNSSNATRSAKEEFELKYPERAKLYRERSAADVPYRDPDGIPNHNLDPKYTEYTKKYISSAANNLFIKHHPGRAAGYLMVSPQIEQGFVTVINELKTVDGYAFHKKNRSQDFMGSIRKVLNDKDFTAKHPEFAGMEAQLDAFEATLNSQTVVPTAEQGNTANVNIQPNLNTRTPQTEQKLDFENASTPEPLPEVEAYKDWTLTEVAKYSVDAQKRTGENLAIKTDAEEVLGKQIEVQFNPQNTIVSINCNSEQDFVNMINKDLEVSQQYKSLAEVTAAYANRGIKLESTSKGDGKFKATLNVQEVKPEVIPQVMESIGLKRIMRGPSSPLTLESVEDMVNSKSIETPNLSIPITEYSEEYVEKLKTEGNDLKDKKRFFYSSNIEGAVYMARNGVYGSNVDTTLGTSKLNSTGNAYESALQIPSKFKYRAIVVLDCEHQDIKEVTLSNGEKIVVPRTQDSKGSKFRKILPEGVLKAFNIGNIPSERIKEVILVRQ